MNAGYSDLSRALVARMFAGAALTDFIEHAIAASFLFHKLQVVEDTGKILVSAHCDVQDVPWRGPQGTQTRITILNLCLALKILSQKICHQNY